MREGFLFHEIVARQIMASTKRRGEPKRKEKRAKKPSRPCRKFSGDQRTHQAERTSEWDDYKVAVERQICSVSALDSSILCCFRVYANGMSSLSV